MSAFHPLRPWLKPTQRGHQREIVHRLSYCLDRCFQTELPLSACNFVDTDESVLTNEQRLVRAFQALRQLQDPI